MQATLEVSVTAITLEPVLGGRYVLGDKLGEGGFGVVHEAQQTEPLRRTVAVKILKAGMDTRQVIARFDAERQALALMDHPHIARVLDAGVTADGRPFFVMERVRGIPVTAFVRQRAMQLVERLDLFTAICDAVQHAHQKGVIHRDLKPSNILIEDNGGRPRPKIIDFGIAKALAGPLTDHTIFTGMDQMLGTPGYMSPEQIEEGAAAVDIRADVFALGALLYELLCDRPAVDPASFAGKPLAQALRELAVRRPARPSLIHPDLAGDLDDITMKALANDPALRYVSADALAQDVRRYLRHEPILARPPSRAYLMKKFVRRHRAGVAAAAAVLLAVLGGAIASTMMYFRAEKSRVVAEQATAEKQAALDARQRSSSRSDFQNARLVSERGRNTDAIIYLCRAIRGDPGNATARAYLSSLLAHVHLAHSVSPSLKAAEGYDRLPFIGLSAATGQAIAICAASKPDAAGQPRSELLSRWFYDGEDRVDEPLPAGARATALLVTPNEFAVVAGLSNGSLLVINLINGESAAIKNVMNGAITALAVTPDSRHLLCGCEDGTARLWDLTEQQPAGGIVTMRGPIREVVIGARPDVAAAVSAGAVVVFDPVAGKLLGAPQFHPGLSAFALQAQGRRIAIGLESGRAQLRVMGSGDYVGMPLGHAGAVTAAAFASEGEVLITGDRHGLLHVWNAETGMPSGPNEQMDGAVIFCQPTPQRGLVMSISDLGELRLWNPLNGALLNSTRTRKKVRAAAMSGGGTHAAIAAADDPIIQVWEMHGRMIEPRYLSGSDQPPAAASAARKPAPEGMTGKFFAWSGDGTRAVCLDDEGSVAFHPGPALPMRFASSTHLIAISNDGRLLATAQADRQVRLWNTITGAQTAPAMLHNIAIRHVAFTPDARIVVTATEDGELRCWDAASGDPLGPPLDRGEKIVALATTANGREILFEKESGGWFTLPLPSLETAAPEWLLQLAEAIARRRLKDDGTTETLAYDVLLKALAAIPYQPTPVEQPAAQLARWLVSNPARRPLWPGDDGEFQDYLATLVETAEPAALREALRFDPLNHEALRLLAEAKQKATGTNAAPTSR